MSDWLADYSLRDLKGKMKHKATEVGEKRTRKNVDLCANPENHTEPLYCSPLNSCYAYNQHDCQLCWANPPWSHLEKMVIKAVLDRPQAVGICPDWG